MIVSILENVLGNTMEVTKVVDKGAEQPSCERTYVVSKQVKAHTAPEDSLE